jgi:hypothetical protein
MKVQVEQRGFAPVIERARLCLFLVSVSFLASAGCAHRVGSQSTRGAMAEINRQVGPEPGQSAAETVARRTTRAMVDELNQPTQRERIDEILTNATDGVRGAMTQGLAEDLGADADGPLAQSIAALAERSATLATRGAMTTLLAGCDPQNPTCLDRRVSDLSTRAAVAFVDGVKQSLRSVALVIAFLAGAATVLVLGLLWFLARRTTDPSGSRRDKRGRSAPAPSAVGARAPASTSA